MVIQRKKGNYGILFYVAVMICVAMFFVFCTESLEKNNLTDSKQTLTESVRKTAVHCYAIEGQYPKDAVYLEENYGLTYNHNKYMVHYQMVGSNLMPDIFVTESEQHD